MEVKAEAAFTVALIQSEAIRAFMQTVPRDAVKMLWLMGYAGGFSDGLKHADEIIGRKAA